VRVEQRGSSQGIIRRARRRRPAIVFWDESGTSLLPVTRQTPGATWGYPVIHRHFKWKRASVASALSATAPVAGVPSSLSTIRSVPTTPIP